VKAGSLSHLDLAREQAQLESVQAQLSSLETAEKQALYSLAALLGPIRNWRAGRTRPRMGKYLNLLEKMEERSSCPSVVWPTCREPGPPFSTERSENTTKGVSFVGTFPTILI
jgi:hypothetical protein